MSGRWCKLYLVVKHLGDMSLVAGILSAQQGQVQVEVMFCGSTVVEI